jgi:hypothetical protein
MHLDVSGPIEISIGPDDRRWKMPALNVAQERVPNVVERRVPDEARLEAHGRVIGLNMTGLVCSSIGVSNKKDMTQGNSTVAVVEDVVADCGRSVRGG